MKDTEQKEQTLTNSAAGRDPATLNFTEISPENIGEYRKLSQSCPYLLACYSAGVLLMWKHYYNAAYTLYSGCVIIKVTINNKVQFLFPFACTEDGDIDTALSAIEKYTSKNSIPLSFYAVPRDELPRLALRYTNLSFSVNRNESDYIYAAEDMKSFAGRKYAAGETSSADSKSAILMPFCANTILMPTIKSWRASGRGIRPGLKPIHRWRWLNWRNQRKHLQTPIYTAGISPASRRAGRLSRSAMARQSAKC